MAQLSDDCFNIDGALLPLDDAIRSIDERVRAVAGIETVPLALADGRVLAADLAAPLDLPPFDNSAVDGYAVRFADLAPGGGTLLPVRGRLAAGQAGGPHPASGSPHAVRVFTGAPMPPGFDTVFMQEDVALERGGARLPAGLASGANRRLAGEDVARGASALAAGRRLGPADIALLGALGLATVEVREPLRVAIASTGNEVAQAGAPLGRAELYDANRPMLAALLIRLGCAITDLGILPDRPDALAAALGEAARNHDLIVSSGGVSTGEEDHVKDAVGSLGALDFWRVGIKPGRPVAMGMVAGTPFIGLPGNPVAVFVTFVFLARHLVAHLQGESHQAPLALPVESAFAYRKKEGRREYVRVKLEAGPSGRPRAHKHPREGAGILTSLTQSDGLVVLPESVTRVAPGDIVGFVAMSALT